MRKRWMILLTIALAVFSVANAESTASVYDRIINIHDSLPSYIIQITDTGEDTADVDSDNILLVEVFSEKGEQLQSFTYFSNESPEYDGVAALVMEKDLNFDGYNDLMLLSAAGAQNVYHAFSLWNVEEQQFRPVYSDCVWLREEARFSDEAVQIELCNLEIFPEQRMLLSSDPDGFYYRREIFYMFDGTYYLEPKYIWDVYRAGDGMIGETMIESMTQLRFLWDEQYPEEWYYGQDGSGVVSTERRKAVHEVALSGSDKMRMRVANVDWVNLRKQDSKASPSLAKINEGENVTVLVDACGSENGWVRVLYSLGEHHSLSQEEYDTGRTTLTGYIWHSYLEPVQ